MPEPKPCKVEDCDAPHCKRCGCHYDPACTEPPGGPVCDTCLIEQAADTARAQAEAFGGDYEAAARYHGW